MDSNQSANPQSENPQHGSNGPFEIQLQLPLALPPPAPPVQPEINPLAPVIPEKKLWGGWPTLGFSAVILIVFFMAQMIIAFIFVFLNPGLITNPTAIMDLTTNGLLLSVATYVSASAGLALVIVFIKIRKGFSVTEYLGLQKPGVRAIFIVLGVTLALMLVSNFISTFLSPGGSSNDQFTVNAYKTVWPPLLWIAVVIFAPVFEESFFRGFLFVGLKNSRLGVAGAVIITALLFGVLHYSQYDIYGVMTIFIFGIALGVIRLVTKSLWATIAVHAFWNFLAMVMTVLVINGIIQ